MLDAQGAPVAGCTALRRPTSAVDAAAALGRSSVSGAPAEPCAEVVDEECEGGADVEGLTPPPTLLVRRCGRLHELLGTSRTNSHLVM